VVPKVCKTMGKRPPECQQAMATPSLTPRKHPDVPDGVNLWSSRVDNDTN